MDDGYFKADCTNLPKINALMIAQYFTENSNYHSSELRHWKTSLASRKAYGDDAIGYVNFKRDDNLCTVKCQICPEHKVTMRNYNATLIVDETIPHLISVECHDCPASLGGCKHAVTFLMWLHRRSEEPSPTARTCYWAKPTLAKVGTSLKFVKIKELPDSKSAYVASDSAVFSTFLSEGKRRCVKNCELVQSQLDYKGSPGERLSLHLLCLQMQEVNVDRFIEKSQSIFTNDFIKAAEVETRLQHNSSLWHELRYSRITASKAHETSKCKTADGSLIQSIMGGKIPDSTPMQRGRKLEEKVRQKVSEKLKKNIRKCGLFISKEFFMIAGSPDGIFEKSLVEIKCPSTEDAYKYYVKDSQITQKFYAQIQLQMYLTGCTTGYFCVADYKFEITKEVKILDCQCDSNYVKNLLNCLVNFWKINVYPKLYKSIST